MTYLFIVRYDLTCPSFQLPSTSTTLSQSTDVSLAARKQALMSLTDLLTARPGDRVLIDAWVAGVLPLAR